MSENRQPEFHPVSDSGAGRGEETTAQPDAARSRSPDEGDPAWVHKRYRISPGFILREIAGEYAIVPVGAGADSPLENTVMAPNETAVLIWKCFETPCTIADVVERGRQTYDADEAVIRQSVERFVAESLTYRILEEV